MDSNKTPQSSLKSLREDAVFANSELPHRSRLTQKLTALTESLELLAHDSLHSPRNVMLGGIQDKKTPPALKLVR